MSSMPGSSAGRPAACGSSSRAQCRNEVGTAANSGVRPAVSASYASARSGTSVCHDTVFTTKWCTTSSNRPASSGPASSHTAWSITPAAGAHPVGRPGQLLVQGGRQVGAGDIDPAHPVLDRYGTRLRHHQAPPLARLQPGPQYVVVVHHRAHRPHQRGEVQPGRDDHHTRLHDPAEAVRRPGRRIPA
ncbi:hypothetical protein SFUMM280S_06072 [Streptomyces fumanus]